MIQLATDPNARNAWRPAASDGKEATTAARFGRSGHAWPFISRHTERPAPTAQDQKRPPNSESGS